MKNQEQQSNGLDDLIKTIHFTESISTKIHRLRDEADILRTVNEQFEQSEHYIGTILLLTEDGESLEILHSSLSSGILKEMEKAARVLLDTYRIDLQKSTIFNQVVRKGQTVQVTGADIIGELVSEKIADLVTDVMGLSREPSLLTPLYRNAKIVGALTITSPELSEEFIPSVRNLAEHISTALEYADEYAERKRAEQALMESEERLRTIFRNASDVIIYLDESGKIIDENGRAEYFFGYSRERLVGKNFTEVGILKREDIPDMVGLFNRAVSSGEITTFIAFQGMHRDGSVLYIEATISVVRKGNTMEGILVHLRDTTARKLAEEALRESEAKWRSLAENVPDIITTVNREGTILFTNHTALGVTPQQAIGMNFFDYLLPGDSELVQEAIEQIFLTGRLPSELEVRGSGEDDVTCWYACRFGPIERDGEMVAMNVIATDVTERKNSEDEIMQRNRELNTLNAIARIVNQSLTLEEILNNALDMMLEILDIKNACVVLIDSDIEYLTLEVHRGMSADLVEAFSQLKVSEGLIGRAVRSRETIYIESLPDSLELIAGSAFRRLVNEQRLKSMVVVPLQARGKVLGVMCAMSHGEHGFTYEERDLLNTIGIEISNAVEYAQLLDEASRAEALEELDRLRTELLASVSHELRTPLTAIKGIAGTLVQSDVEWDTATQKDFLETIDRETDTLTHIVDDLMEMSQLEAGIMKMEKKPSKISSIVRQLSEQLKTTTLKHVFESNVPSDLPSIYADEIRIGEVIVNLVANAASYSEKGTRILLDAQQVDGHIVVNVTDQGIGIIPEHIDKVFDRFYRLESGIARRRGGTGLGLSICKGIVEAHDGNIWVASSPSGGSKFSFSLPIVNE